MGAVNCKILLLVRPHQAATNFLFCVGTRYSHLIFIPPSFVVT